MAFSIIPKDEKFFDLLEEASDNVVHSAQVFVKLVQNWSDTSPLLQEIRDLEHQGDRMTHEIIDKLNRTFITPIDREDIHALASELDDVIDVIQSTSDRMQLYRVSQPPESLGKLATVLLRSTETIGKAVKSLREMSHTRRTLDFCIEVNSFENEGDVILKTMLKDLFTPPKDALDVMKWKEIYEAVEFATDKCEDIANTIEGIVVKNA